MALVKLAAHDLRQITTVAQMAQMDETLDLLPTERFPIIYPKNKTLQRHANVVLLRVEEIVALAQDYLLRHTPNGQHKALLELQRKLQSFQQAIALIPTPTGPEFQQVAAQWQAIVNAAEVELRPRLPFENPFIAGNPLLEHEANLFKGRRDLVVKLEEAIFGQRPSLLLYGRRRTGKTSTLLNLPRLMSSQFVPVFIDCQNARWNDSDAMFCYHLTRALNDELVKRKLAEGLVQPSKNEFEQHAFTRLDEFLDELEAHSHRIGKQILLTFDEYERLEEGIGDGKLTRAVLNQIRAIVQHRERLIVLFSGSHRFEELQTVNWSDYLINVQTLYLSFLTRDEARELIEHPAPEFALGYAPGVVDRVLDLTHGQPYLVQALGSELVNLINREKRKEATRADLDVAIERVLGMADAYFENNWRDCNEQEQVVLRELVTQQVGGLPAVERQRALLGLSRKELVEQRGGQWQFTVELFGLWVKREKTAAVMALSMA
ncbi:MAG: AAA family ATPase [Acidobacteria bacterium]|nr:AAA family ATPase [Acidobacteriota bacterium]MBI3423098.1 AAA family ATPase [Acidobacteriota bacterium]